MGFIVRSTLGFEQAVFGTIGLEDTIAGGTGGTHY